MFDKIQSTYFKRVTTGVLALFMTASSGFSYAVPVYAEEVTTAAAKRKKEEEFSSTESSTLQLNENSTKEEVKNDQDTGNDDVKVTTNGSSEDQPEVTYEKPDTKEPGRKLSSEEAQKDLKKIIESKKYSYEDILQRVFEIDDFSFYSSLTSDDIKFLMSGKTDEKYEILEILKLKSVNYYDYNSLSPKKFYLSLFSYFKLIDQCDEELSKDMKEHVQDQVLKDINQFYVKEKSQYYKNINDFYVNDMQDFENVSKEDGAKYVDAISSYIYTKSDERDKNVIRKALDLEEVDKETDEKELEDWVTNDKDGSFTIKDHLDSLKGTEESYNQGGDYGYSTNNYFYVSIHDNGGNDTNATINITGRSSKYGDKDKALYQRMLKNETTWNCSMTINGANNHNLGLTHNTVTTKQDKFRGTDGQYAWFVMNFKISYTRHAYYYNKGCSYDKNDKDIRFNTKNYTLQNTGDDGNSIEKGYTSYDKPVTANIQINTGHTGTRTFNHYRYRGGRVTINYTREKHTIRYDANGGSGAPGNQTKTMGVDLWLSSTTPSRSQYVFKGWNTQANGSGTSYSPGQQFYPDADTTLYAQWEEDTSYQYLDVNGELDGTWQGNLDGLGSCDVYVNGTCVGDDITDFWTKYPAGTKWEIRDIKTASGKKYRGITPGLSGTIGSSTASVVLQYTSGSTLSIDPNGGTYKGSSGVTTVNHVSPNQWMSIESPTRSGYKFAGYVASGNLYWFTSSNGVASASGTDSNSGATYSQSYVDWEDRNTDGHYYTVQKWTGISAPSDSTWNHLEYPSYTAEAGHTYRITGQIKIVKKPSGGYSQLNLYHGAYCNDWENCKASVGETGKWVDFSMDRTFDTTVNQARFEIFTSDLKGLSGDFEFYVQRLKTVDLTTGKDVPMTQITMGDNDVTLTARWIPLHSTLSYDAQGGSLSSVKSTDNPNNYKIVDNGDYFIQSGLNSSRYLHDYDCSVNNGAKVCTWQGYATNAKQCIWTFERYKNTPYYYIINKYNGKALNLSGDGSGTQNGSVEMWTQLDGSNAAQSDFLWYFKDAGDGYVTICNKLTDKALDIPNAEDNDGVKLQQYTPNGSNAQKFKLLNSMGSKSGDTMTTPFTMSVNEEYLTERNGSLTTVNNTSDSNTKWILKKGHYGYYIVNNSTGKAISRSNTSDHVEMTSQENANEWVVYTGTNNSIEFEDLDSEGPLEYSNGTFKCGDTADSTTFTTSYDISKDISRSEFKLSASDFPTREKYTDSNVYINSATPVKKGCKFLGWSTSKNGSVKYQPGDLYDVNQDGGNVTLYAQWEKAKYTATVKLNGGSYNGSTNDFTISKYPGEEVSIAAPTRSKHNFTGYKLTMDDDDGDTPTNIAQSTSGFKGIMQMGNFTLTAQWTPWKHKVVYNANAKNDASVKGIPEYQNKIADVNIKLSSDIPTRNGYTFLGWNTKADGKGTAYAAGAIYKNDQNGGTVTLYAQWTPWKHVLHYNKNVPTSSTSQTVSNMPVDQTKTFGRLMTISNLVPTRKGYTFAGWYTQSNGTGTKYDPGSNYAADQNGGTVNLYAKWTPWTYNIKYDQNVKSTSSSKTVTDMPAAQTKTQEIDVTLSSMTPKRSGYTFAGWSTSANGSVEYKPGSKFTKDLDSNGASITLYAVWTPWKHTVHYNSNIPTNAPTGTTTVSNMPGDQTKTFDEKLIISSNKPTRKGYNFAGWSTSANGNVVYQPGAEYKNDQNGGTVTLYAKWTAWKHTVTYDKNVPASSKKADVKNMPGNQTKIYDQNLTLQSNVPTRVGYTFVKWTTNKDGTGTAYQPGSQYSYNRDSDGGTVILYAVWTPWKYTVRYDKNVPADSSSQTVSNMPADQTKTEEVALTLSSNKPTRNGYIFNGWQVQINGKAVDYQPGATLSYDPDVKGSVITLKAKWTAWKHTIHYDKNVPASSKKTNVTNMPGDQVKVFDTALSIRPMIPKRTGYTFAGWSTTANGKAEYQPGDKYNHDQNDGTVTLYAVWTPWKYKVQYDKNVSSDSSSQTVSNMPADQTKTEEVNLTLSSNKPSRHGYIFNGWQAQINGKAVDYQPGATLSYDVDDKDGSTIILKAQWTAWKHTVHYDKNVPANSSSQTVTNMPEDQTKTFDEKLNLSTKIPKREGYNFRGWLLEYGTAIAVVSPGTAYERDQNGGTYVLKAQWEPWKHTVHYDANGGDQSSVPNDQKKTYEQNMNVATKVPTRNEYKFLGWKAYHEYKDKDGNKHSEFIGDYQPGASYNYDIDETGQYAADNGEYNKCGTVTMKAQWVQLYTVKYDGNQPAIKGVTVTGSVANQTQGQDESVNLRTNNFKNDSGVYKDWSVGKDAYKYKVRTGSTEYNQYIHPEGFKTNHSAMQNELRGYRRLEDTMIQN